MSDLEPFFVNRIVTRNLVEDIVESVRNRVGLRQRGYEKMVQETADELIEQVHDEYEVEWFRVDVDVVGNGAMSVNVYGQGRR